MIQFAVSKF